MASCRQIKKFRKHKERKLSDSLRRSSQKKWYMVIKYKQTFKVIRSKFISSLNTEPGHILVLGKPHNNEQKSSTFKRQHDLVVVRRTTLDLDSSSTTYKL